MKIAIIISTNGSVLSVLLKHNFFKSKVSLIISDRECGAIELAKTHDLEHKVLKSKSGIHRIVQGLLERDYIIKLNNKARSIYPKKYPNGKIYSTLKQDQDNKEFNNINTLSIPLLGKIAAGLPIEAIETANENIEVPISFLGKGKCYALKVDGDSMIEAGILQDDIAIIDSEKHPVNGDIVVALIDEEDVTLKRFRKNGESIALEPANINYKTYIYGPNRIKVQGVLTSLYRHY